MLLSLTRLKCAAWSCCSSVCWAHWTAALRLHRKHTALSQAERQFKPCVKGDFSFLRESQKFDPPQNQNPWTDWNKIWHIWLRRRDNPQRKILRKSVYVGLLDKSVKDTQKILDINIHFLLQHSYRSDPWADFYARWLKP